MVLANSNPTPHLRLQARVSDTEEVPLHVPFKRIDPYQNSVSGTGILMSVLEKLYTGMMDSFKSSTLREFVNIAEVQTAKVSMTRMPTRILLS